MKLPVNKLIDIKKHESWLSLTRCCMVDMGSPLYTSERDTSVHCRTHLPIQAVVHESDLNVELQMTK